MTLFFRIRIHRHTGMSRRVKKNITGTIIKQTDVTCTATIRPPCEGKLHQAGNERATCVPYPTYLPTYLWYLLGMCQPAAGASWLLGYYSQSARPTLVWGFHQVQTIPSHHCIPILPTVDSKTTRPIAELGIEGPVWRDLKLPASSMQLMYVHPQFFLPGRRSRPSMNMVARARRAWE